MKRILVTYATMAGSTADVAQTIAEAFNRSDVQVDILPLAQVESLAGYDGVVVGGPMIMGWHRQAMGFLKKHRQALQQMPLALFVMAISLTQTGETSVGGVPIYVDDKLPKSPEQPGHLRFRERHTRVSHYIQPILTAVRPVRPVRIGIFGGRLEYGRLKWWAVLFVMVIIQAPAGDRRNWTAIRAWAAELPVAFECEGLSAEEKMPLA